MTPSNLAHLAPQHHDVQPTRFLGRYFRGEVLHTLIDEMTHPPTGDKIICVETIYARCRVVDVYSTRKLLPFEIQTFLKFRLLGTTTRVQSVLS